MIAMMTLPQLFNNIAVDKDFQLAGLELGPGFIGGERLRHDDGNTVIGGGDFGEIDGQVFIRQFGGGKRMLPHDVIQIGGAMGKQGRANPTTSY